MNLEAALKRLKENGYKYTGKREMMVEIFSRESRYLSAKEVLDYMHEEYPALSFDTVYRNLSLFEELGILEATEWNGERKYRFHCGSEDHHHHLICTECGKTLMIHICPMNALVGTQQNFEITGHKFEIYGRCETCQTHTT
jgi:Fur family zinc uptake transcriptional regulator